LSRILGFIAISEKQLEEMEEAEVVEFRDSTLALKLACVPDPTIVSFYSRLPGPVRLRNEFDRSIWKSIRSSLAPKK
jgi:hypothetical protein